MGGAFGHAPVCCDRTTMRVALINPNTTAATTAAMVALAQAEAAGAFAVEGVTAAFGAPVIVDEAALAVGAQAVAQAAAGWARAGSAFS